MRESQTSLLNERRFICDVCVAHCRGLIEAVDGVATAMSSGDNTLLVTLSPGRQWPEVRGQIRQILEEEERGENQ